MMSQRREPFVTTREYLMTARDFDITEEECILEVIDNSLDAGATDVRIHVGKTQASEPRISIVDDGCGIPETHIDEDGEEREGIPFVIAYGGRITHVGNKGAIGKYGWGLSQAATSVSRRTEIFSRTPEEGSWRHCYYDFDELIAEENVMLPEQSTVPVPTYAMGYESGTIVSLIMDKSKVKYLGSMINRLEYLISRTYRRALASGRKISIVNEEKDPAEVMQIKLSDPLHQIPSSKEVSHFGVASSSYPVTIRMDGSTSLGTVIDPKTQLPAEIRIRLTLVNSEKVYERIGLNPGAAGKTVSSKLSAWHFDEENQGFSVLRNGREIVYGDTLGLFSKNTKYRFIRCELEFPEILDDLFSVQVNKSRMTLDQSLRQILKQRVGGSIRDLLRDHSERESRTRVRVATSKGANSEFVAGMLASRLQKPKVSKKERKEAEAEIEKRIDSIIKKETRKAEDRIDRAEENLSRVKKTGEKDLINTAEVSLEAAKKEKEATIARIRNRFEFKSPFRKEMGTLGTGDMYAIDHLGDEVWVTINMDTHFFKSVYERSLMNPETESLLDLMIFSMAWAEHLKRDEKRVKEFWNHARPLVSQQAHTLCNSITLEDES
jgi:hypothetical protein